MKALEDISDENMIRFFMVELVKINGGYSPKIPFGIRRRLRRLGLIEDVSGGLRLTPKGVKFLKELNEIEA